MLTHSLSESAHRSGQIPVWNRCWEADNNTSKGECTVQALHFVQMPRQPMGVYICLNHVTLHCLPLVCGSWVAVPACSQRVSQETWRWSNACCSVVVRSWWWSLTMWVLQPAICYCPSLAYDISEYCYKSSVMVVLGCNGLRCIIKIIQY